MRKIDVEQGSLEWHRLRQGKVTGTTLKSAIGSPKVQETLMYKIIAELMTEPQISDINSASVARGRELEPIARKAVEAKSGINFIETGMLISDDIEGFGMSPDGIFEDKDGKIIGGLEIKCPDSKTHIKYCIDGGLPKEYDDQVKAPFLMSDDIQWWYFASFDDRNYELPLFLIRISRDQWEGIERDREKLKAFISSVSVKHAQITF
jgi:hypothetical protein